MTDERPVSSRVDQWVAKAEGDFTAAVHLLTLPDDTCPFDVVCFHAQQCVEKYLKAALVESGVPPPRTHDLAELSSALPSSLSLSVDEEDLSALTPYAVEARYPAVDAEFVGREDAERAAEIARRVRTEFRARLASPR
jgi:HEPN domain-containing protein